MNDQILIVYLFIRLRKLEERLGRTERIMDAVLVPINAGRYLFTQLSSKSSVIRDGSKRHERRGQGIPRPRILSADGCPARSRSASAFAKLTRYWLHLREEP